MTGRPLAIEDRNLSHAWGRALLALTARGVSALSPRMVTVTGFSNGEAEEDGNIRRALDGLLAELDPMLSCHAVANTIFPQSLWNPDRVRGELFARFDRIRTRVRRHPRNRYGQYFDRLTHYEGAPESGNQLEHLIRTFRDHGNHRKSALQASVLDPRHDLTHQRQRGFPCLQQVAFTPDDRGGLAVTGIYATQYLVERAYGNYLGLARLGQFMAHELGLQLTQMTCFSCYVTLGNVSKERLASLSREVRERLEVRSRAEPMAALPSDGAADAVTVAATGATVDVLAPPRGGQRRAQGRAYARNRSVPRT